MIGVAGMIYAPIGIAYVLGTILYEGHMLLGVADGLSIGAVSAARGVLTNLGAKTTTKIANVEAKVVHGNSLKSMRPTWGYKLYNTNGTFLKNGITSKPIPEKRYTRGFMKGKYMDNSIKFPNRKAAWDWEYKQNLINRGPLNKNMH